MRNDYGVVDRYFTDLTYPQKPNRVIIHRQGNPGAKAINAIDWMATQGLSIHEYVDGTTVYHCRHWDQLARHVNDQPNERRVRDRVAAMGFVVTRDNVNYRGDWDSIGIETCDESGPNGAPRLSQDTRISLLLRVRDVCRISNIPVEKVYEHSDFDPWNRSQDLGDALNMDDFRADVADLLAGREAWRTVQAEASGSPAPQSWKPVTPVIDQRALTNALNETQAALNKVRDIAGGK